MSTEGDDRHPTPAPAAPFSVTVNAMAELESALGIADLRQFTPR